MKNFEIARLAASAVDSLPYLLSVNVYLRSKSSINFHSESLNEDILETLNEDRHSQSVVQFQNYNKSNHINRSVSHCL